MNRILHLARFGGVSAVCLLLHNLVLIASAAVGVRYGLAVIASYMIVVIVGFALHSLFTFGTSPSLRALARYAMALIGNVPAQWALLWILIDRAGIPMVWAAPLSTAALIVFNFLASRWALAGMKPQFGSQGRSI